MHYNTKAAGTLLPMTVTEGVTVNILPDGRHEFLMTTREVAVGYGVCRDALRKVALRYAAELEEGKHYLAGVTLPHRLFGGTGTNCPSASPGASKGTLWTKRGIVRLGFFIRSERARLFRDWAEDLVLATLEGPAVPAPAAKSAGRPRRINRLTPARVIDLLSDVCLIENKELRERIAAKLKGGLEYGNR